MSETKLLLAEIQALKRKIQALETVEEHPGYAASDVARLSQNNTFDGIQTIPNTGLHILDTDASHDLIIAPGSDLSADVTLLLVMTANRTLTLTGNATLDQDVSTAGTPTFAQLTVDNLRLDGNVLSSTSGAVTVTPLAGQNFNVSLSGAGKMFLSGENPFLWFEDTTITTGTDFSISANEGLMVFSSSPASGKFSFDISSSGTTFSDGIILSVSNVDTTTNNWATIGFGQQSSGYHAAIGAQMTDRTPGTRDADLVFFLIANNAWAEKIRVKNNGNFLVGTSTDNGGKAQIDQSSTTAAIPALRLTQADISEGYIDYIGTSAASAAGPISSWTVATIAGFTRCEINGAAYWQPYYNAPTA